MCPNGAIVAIIATAMPSPTRQLLARRRGDAVAPGQRRLGEVEALVEAVRSPDDVRLRSARRS
jgi:hypothetical protein